MPATERPSQAVRPQPDSFDRFCGIVEELASLPDIERVFLALPTGRIASSLTPPGDKANWGDILFWPPSRLISYFSRRTRELPGA